MKLLAELSFEEQEAPFLILRVPGSKPLHTFVANCV